MTILFPEQIDVSKTVVSEAKGTNCKIYYKLDEELVKFKIQTGKMRLPWDPKERKNQNGKVISMNVSASTFGMFDDANKSRVETFKKKLEEIENLINLDKNMSLNSVIYGTNPDFSPVVNLSIPYSSGRPDVIVFDKDGKNIPFSSVKKGSVCTFIIRVSHFWKSKNKCGLQLVIEQIKLNNVNNEKKIQFLDDSDSDDDDIN